MNLFWPAPLFLLLFLGLPCHSVAMAAEPFDSSTRSPVGLLPFSHQIAPGSGLISLRPASVRHSVVAEQCARRWAVLNCPSRGCFFSRTLSERESLCLRAKRSKTFVVCPPPHSPSTLDTFPCSGHSGGSEHLRIRVVALALCHDFRLLPMLFPLPECSLTSR